MRFDVRHIALTLLLAGASACEQTITDFDVPSHKEQLVSVASVRFEGDSMYTSCSVSRTLPLSTPYRAELASIRNATVTLHYGTTVDTIPFTGDGLALGAEEYYAYQLAQPRSDASSLRLEVRHEGRNVMGQLDVPRAPLSFDSVALEVENKSTWPRFYFRYAMPVGVQQRRYFCTLQFQSAWSSEWISHVTREIIIPAGAGGEVFTGRFEIPQWFDPDYPWRYYLVAVTDSYDEIYSAIVQRYRNGGPFDPTPKNPRFNMIGDGFGFFTVSIIGESHKFL